jgi:hypothetical protein
MPVDEDLEPAENISEGRIIAVKICSHVLDACIWFSFDPDCVFRTKSATHSDANWPPVPKQTGQGYGANRPPPWG